MPDKERLPELSDYGYVYFVERAGYVKVGYTQDLHNRMSAFQANSPFDFQLVGAIRSDEYKTLEESIQNSLANYHKKGEWYDINVQTAKEIIFRHNGNLVDDRISDALKSSSKCAQYSYLLDE